MAVDLRLVHAEVRAVEVDVLTAGQLRVEAGADLEQACDPAVEVDLAARRLRDAGLAVSPTAA
jgi:hypothetical protein